MNVLKIDCTSASYDEDLILLTEDTPKIRRAIELRREHCARCGDGNTDVETVTDRSANTSEEDFIEFVVTDISNGDDDDAIHAFIEGAA